ncbi:unnamed protein product [Lupinus luteus]|uniref:Uncharacterized protein n=1 Tax=Lupinus luteus TaxID=3873 RepID=A0AAV1W794_LUPLU
MACASKSMIPWTFLANLDSEKIDNIEGQPLHNLERIPSSPVLVEGGVEDLSNEESVGTRVEESIEPELNIMQQLQVENFEIQPIVAMNMTAAKESKLVRRLWADESDEDANEENESTYTKVLSKSQKKKLRQKRSQERVHFTRRGWVSKCF